MFEPIICSCGLCIGHLVEMFEMMKEALYRDAYGDDLPDPVYMPMLDTKVEMGEVLDSLCLYEDCCRRTMMTYTCFRDYW